MKKGDGMDSGDRPGPGISVPPPVIYLVALLVGLGLDHLWPTAPFSARWGYVAGAVLIILPILIMPPVLIRFRRAGTPFDVRKTASALITDGPYRFSRNPSYVSLTLLYVGLGVVLNTVWVLLLVIPVLLIMHFGVVLREERHLEARFGEEYVRYKSAVRRWL